MWNTSSRCCGERKVGRASRGELRVTRCIRTARSFRRMVSWNTSRPQGQMCGDTLAEVLVILK